MTELESLKAECARLRRLLDDNGIDWRPKPERSVMSLQQKVELFRSLFVGREDVFARRWYSPKSGKSGYQPVCANEWSPVCDKKTYKCADCPNRAFQAIGYNDLYRHLEGRDSFGRDVMGSYAILPDNTCRFLCADFDDKSCEHGYQADVLAYMSACQEWNIPSYIERSRSGNGAHVWILFEKPVKARDARILGNAILTEAMEKEAGISFKSYDRFFPNQDFMPEGGLGNLVALPLQGAARREGNSVFVDNTFKVIPDQWAYLHSMKKIGESQLQTLLNLYGTRKELGELSTSTESEPWSFPCPKQISPAILPSSIELIYSNGIYIPIANLPQKALTHLKRLAAFKNPEFYAKQAMRLPTFNLPRIVSCSELTDSYLILPRGCEEAIRNFFQGNSVECKINDLRQYGKNIEVQFKGNPYPEQTQAIDTLIAHPTGILHATTAFGKTVTAIALIARLKVNTLILVHTKALLDQWRLKLEEFLNIEGMNPDTEKKRSRRKKYQKFGALSSNENSLTGTVDVALIQSCLSDTEVKPFIKDYGLVIVDECHHISAISFEKVMKEVCAAKVYGLTATPIRKDGHQPIIFMQCGPIRYSSDSKKQMESQNFRRSLIPRFSTFRYLTEDKRSFSQIVRDISEDSVRNNLLVKDISDSLSSGRTPIVLTSLTSHVKELAERLEPICANVITLIGSDSAKQKREVIDRLSQLSAEEKCVIIATGKYIGEGFDFPRLDTLFLATPVSWKGLIAQYAGRLHRNYPDKTEVIIYDYVDLYVHICDSMYRKRLNGYKAVGYSMGVMNENLFSEIKTESIYDSENFERVFHSDLGKAKKSVLIACKKLVWKRPPKVLDLLNALTVRGVEVMVVISETGNSEGDIENYGLRLKQSKVSNPNCVVIDREKIWYGSINFIGRSLSDSTAIRLEDSTVVQDLLSSILKGCR